MNNYSRNSITPVTNKLDYISSKQFECQIFDYHDSNEEYEDGKEFTITLFGVNKKGNSVCIIVNGFNPFFYVKAPEGITDINKFLAYLKFHAGRKHYYAYKGIIKDECKEEMKKNFYGYRCKKELFFKLTFKDSMSFHVIKKLFNEPLIINNTERKIQVFEGNFDPVLRFFHMRNIAPCGWATVKEYEYEEGTSNCQIEIRLHWESISGIEDDDSVAPIIQASYDIECYSVNPDVFPQPEVEGNVVTQIATAFKKYGDKDFFLKHIITLKKCSPIIGAEGEPPIIVESYDTEAEVIKAWKNLLLSTDPDIIYSYNGDGFDGNYLYKRAEISGVKNEFLKYGKLKLVSGKLNETTFTSGAYGSTDYKRLVIPGRVNFDLLIYMNREFKLSSYKLDFVAETYIGQNKNPMTPRQMFEYFKDGHPDKIKEIAEYCFCEGTRVSLPSCSVDIKSLENLETNVISWVENKGFSESKKVHFFNNGYKECIKLTLTDGTQINCTKNHRFLTKTGWVEAQDLTQSDKILQYPEPALCDYEAEYSQSFKFSEDLVLQYEKACIFSRILGYLLTDGCISDSSCYKNYSQGRVKYVYTTSMVYMGTIYDAKNIQKDIMVLCGKKMSITKQKNTFCIKFPVSITNMFLSIEGVEKGSRLSSNNGLPSFIKNENTPLWVVREFLKGLMGGDGSCPTLYNNKFSCINFVQSKTIDQKECLNEYMINLQKLFNRFGIKTTLKNPSKNKSGEGYTQTVSIIQSDLIAFYEKIGYAYCYGKSYKLAIAASYYKLRKETNRQFNWVSNRAVFLKKENKMKKRDAVKQAHEELKEKEPIFNDYYSLPNENSINWKRQKQTESNFKSKFFPSVTEYLKLTESYDRFTTSNNQHSYALKQYEEYAPCYYLSILDKNEIGMKKVYDIEVKDTHNFVANGSVVHNCIKDTLLPQLLIDKLNVLINQVEMAKITLVPIKFLWERGQQIKVFSQIIKRTAQKDFLIPTRTFTKDYVAAEEEEEKFQGATVLDPKRGAYFEPIVTLDFSSLYPSIIRAHNFCYSTFVLDNKLHEEEAKDTKNTKDTEYIEWEDESGKYKYGFVQDRSISVLPELLSDLFNARVAVRRKMKGITDEFLLGVLDKKQLAIKVSMNSVYGFLASQMIKCKPIAACVTAVGRQMILKTKNYIESNYDASCIIYGDSVSGNTPLLLKDKKGGVCIKTIDTLGLGLGEEQKYQEYPGFKIGDETIRNEKQFCESLYQVWTDLGWADIKKVIRHKTTKKMFRVLTHTGCVDVTEDHSLCTPDLKSIKPKDVSVGNHLLHSYPEFDKNGVIKFEDLTDIPSVNKEGFFYGDAQEILNASFDERLSFFKGYYAADGSKCLNEKEKTVRFDIKGKTASACLFYLCKSLGFNCSLNNPKRDIFRITCSFSSFRNEETEIKKIIELPSSNIQGDYVYDLETEVGRFQAGVGQMIVKNTDSVFVKFNLQHLPKEEQMKEAFRLGKESADKATNILFKAPIKLEFEKVFNPLLLFGKKMYIGQLYSSSPEKPDYTDKKGVVSKRRDNAPIVKRIYNKTVDIIMNEGDKGVSKAIDYIKFELQNLLLDKVDMNELTLSKTLKSNYKSQNLPHKIVAEKMAERDPGSAPKSNDRVEYVFIENQSKKQFEKAEDPQFVLKNGIKLDSLYYIRHQLQNPLCQVLELVTEDAEQIFKDITSAYEIKQKTRLLRQKQDSEGQLRITSFFKKKSDIKE